jgi:peptide/nickel transport system substrate-binding protein
VLLAAAFLLVLPPGAGAAKKFVIAFQGDAATLDGQGRNEGTTISIQNHIYDQLVFQGIDGNLEPGLAVSWKPLSNTRWRIKLRKGVRFHNGTPLTAQGAVDALIRASGKTFKKSQMKHYAKWQKNYRVIDDTTFEIETIKPWPSLPAELSRLSIVPVKHIQKVGDVKFARNPIGTGAYKFVEWVKDDHLDLVANENYWKGAPSIKNVRIRPIPVNAARTAGLLSGEIDAVWGIAPVDAKKLEANPKINIYRQITARTIYLTFDHWRKEGGPYKKNGPHSVGIPKGKPNPFMKLKVRQAVAHGLNVPELLRTVMHGSGKPATQLNPPIAFGYNKRIKRLPYNLAKAKKLLAEAGFPNGFETRVDCPNNRYINDGPMCEAISGMLSRIGIKAMPNPRPKAVFFKRMSRGDFSMFMAGWGTDLVGPTFSTVFHTRNLKGGVGRINRGRYSNPAVDTLMNKASVVMDEEQRRAMWEKAWTMVIDDLAFLPLYQQEAIIATQKNVSLKPRFNEWLLAQEVSVK